MQFTIATFATLFAAALSAPTEVTARSDIVARQAAFANLAIWSQSGCQDGSRTGTVALTNSTVCQNLPAGIVSGRIENNLRAGCTIVFHIGQGCTSAQTITIPKDQTPHDCFEGGQGKQIGSALVSGTCA